MKTRHFLGPIVLASLAALAAAGARAAEAAQWAPSAGATSDARNDAMREPGAWTVGHGEATQFRDAVAPDTMSSRSQVRQALAQAKQRGWLADAGEAGATERVWSRRAAFVMSERDRELAPASASSDPIGVIAALETEPPVDHATYALAPAGDVSLADSATVEVR